MVLVRAVARSLATTLIFFVVAECLLRAAYLCRNALVTDIPLPYVVGDDYGPIPPWLDNLLILRPDDRLIWSNIPNAQRSYVDIFAPVARDEDRRALLRRFVPWLPPAFRSNAVWKIALNGDGFRSPPMTQGKRAGSIRIACLGDSWTFGMNVNQDATYPSRLAALLKQRQPGADFDVMNFGVLGYSSFQGLALLKQRVLDLNPDVLLVGFGMNDSEVPGYRDKDLVQSGPTRWSRRIKDLAQESAVYKLLQYVALALRFRPQTMGDFLKAGAGSKSAPVNYDDIEAWTRVSPRDFDRNLREMIALARARGVRVVLLDNELWPESPYRAGLASMARDEGVPLVDSLRAIMDEKQRIERALEARLGLQPATSSISAGTTESGETTVIFRAYEGSYPVARHLSIVGTDPGLGGLVPNAIAMHDDGTSGDERAGDGVWSYQATFPAGRRLRYVYTNSGDRGRWEGLDVPHVRELTVGASPGSQRVYLPIDTFGKIYMQADNWHTDELGYQLIANAVVAALN